MSLGSITFTSVSWTTGDTITEAKLDSMHANEQAYDSHAAQGVLLNNNVGYYQKLAAGTNTEILNINASDILEVADTGIAGIVFRAPAHFTDGIMHNMKISMSVSSNDLIFAIKGEDGDNNSSDNLGWVAINSSKRKVDSARTFTLADGTNYFAAGAAELATKAIDYFVYAVWNTTPATDRVDFIAARFPSAQTYADFSATTTNEKYGAYTGADQPQSTDRVTLVGRFTATLSAGAAYTWSISGTGNVINKPIDETDTLTWTPVWSGTGSLTYTSITVNTAVYQIKGRRLFLTLNAIGTTGGVTNTTINATAPFTALSTMGTNSPLTGNSADTASAAGRAAINGGSNSIGIRKYDASNWGLGANRGVGAGGEYFIS
jgi:hypothetical protein